MTCGLLFYVINFLLGRQMYCIILKSNSIWCMAGMNIMRVKVAAIDVNRAIGFCFGVFNVEGEL